MIQLNYRDARPIYAQVIDGFREQIITGVLRPGERLPSVRELAGELAINPNTIQRSYRELEMEGWIATVPGKGCFVCGRPMEDPREELRLLHVFEDTVKQLLAMGYTPRELCQRIEEGQGHV